MIESSQRTEDVLVEPAFHQSEESLQLGDAKLSELSGEFIGRWTHLVSTTNWEKGRIICQWREALMGSECGPSGFSDEAWSRRVGGVSAQHVGRLRRVHERFGACYPSYSGLYWSHFLAALDWGDAELWLEGAAQSNWSVSQMRRTRFESLGSDPNDESSALDLYSSTDDEDYVPLSPVDTLSPVDALSPVDTAVGVQDDQRRTDPSGPRYDDPDFGDDDPSLPENRLESSEDELAPWQEQSTKASMLESPFAKLPSLPVDMAEALEQFKLAIIRHRAGGWSEVSKEDIVLVLESLKAFALQPT